MRVIPQMKKCCLCYSLKTGSFTIAFMLLVGSAVQTGYYGYLIKHSKPIQMCTEHYYNHHRVFVYEMLPTDEVAGLWPPYFSLYNYALDLSEYRRGRSILEADNLQEGPEGDTESTSTGEKQAVNSTDTATANAEMGTTDRSPTTTTKAPKRSFRRYNQPRGRWVFRKTQYSYTAPCRKPTRMPFDIDVNFLNFDLSGPFNKDILYFNLCLFGTMMCFTPLLMYAVYKESRGLLLSWLVAETTLLSAAVAGTVVASASLLKVLQVSVGVVTLVNMAFHLAIDIYFVMVVFNFRKMLEIKDEDETEEIQI